MSKRIVVVAGPTASGKTELSLALAERLNGEIVSADSMQIYRGMDIGTAKPTIGGRRGIPHHMLDVAEPGDDWSVSRYEQQASNCVDDILRRGRLPILCGGTGLYINAVISGAGFQASGADSGVRAALEKLRTEGKASVLVAENGACIGVIALSDVLRPEAKDMVSRLSAMHVRTVLLTGDNRKTADYFAKQVGISEVRAELLPEEKVQNVKALQASGRNICMIGDGVNDAPALKIADVGVAMGSMGSDIAVEAADIALMSDDISKIPYLKRLSNATVKTIQFSITLSMCINFAAIVLSLLEVLTPVTGALVHNAGSCFVVLIAALLYDRKFE